VPGLINAYKSAAELALNKAAIIEKTINEKIEITFTYENINEVYQLLRSESATIIHQQLEEECLVTIEIRKNNVTPLIERFKNHPLLAYKSTWKIIENL
jgi:putative IMPACT (imprinted ancient) family translation regulator